MVVTSAAAVTGSTPDGDAHPYVGALVVDGRVTCSGVLIAPTVFATAGHCGTDGARVGVSLDSALGASPSVAAGTLEVDSSVRADLAVVVLDQPVAATPASLPAAGLLESLARAAVVTTVGYGYSSVASDGSFVYDGVRRAAASPVLKVDKSTLTISTKLAGPCLGDSGGPQLAGDTALALTSNGAKDCSGKAEGYRLDTASARSFLAAFVTLP